MPILLRLEQLRTKAEATLQKKIGVPPFNHQIGGGPDYPACGIGLGFDIERGALSMRGRGSSIATDFGLKYRIAVRKRVPCRKFFGPLFEGRCGYGREGLRQAAVTLTSTFRLNRDWNADLVTIAGPLRPITRCNARVFGGALDITGFVMSSFKAAIDKMAKELDTEAEKALALRSRAEEVWRRLQAPIEVDEGLWLTVSPQTMGYAPLTVVGSEVRTGVRLIARPEVVLGPKPSSSSAPLPEAEAVESSDDFRVLLPVRLEHNGLRSQLKRRIAKEGVRFPPIGNRQIRVVDVDVYGYGTKAVLRVDFVGGADGRMYLVGTPTYSGAMNTLSFPDLEYDLETKNLILKVMDWFNHEEFRGYLRGEAVLDLSEDVQRARSRLTAALNKDYEGLRMKGTVASLDLLGFYGKPETTEFLTYLQSRGTLELSLDVIE